MTSKGRWRLKRSSSSREQLQREVDELGPWFYEFDFGLGVKTEPRTPPHVIPIFDTRLQMIRRAIEGHFGDRITSVQCLDIGCHEGFYTIAMRKMGMPRVLGIDVRPDSLRRARFVARTLGLDVDYQELDCEALHPDVHGTFSLTLLLGVLYHLENPMRCLRNIAALTEELCIVETQIVDDVSGTTEWGAHDWTRRYSGVLALIDETPEYGLGNPETGATPLALCPSRNALLTMLKHAGFARVDVIPPPTGAYEQHARGRRIVVAAHK
jgi:tRNA (mo5U34)-methyltransferase